MSSGSTTNAVTVDCANATRPSEPAAGDEPPGDGDRYTYPEPPSSPTLESAVRSYVTAFERAYRLNALYAEYGTQLFDPFVSVGSTWTFEAPERAAIARVRYQYAYGVERDDGGTMVDSPTVYASYYVDDTGVRRAVSKGQRTDESELVPDPIDRGLPVACY